MVRVPPPKYVPLVGDILLITGGSADLTSLEKYFVVAYNKSGVNRRKTNANCTIFFTSFTFFTKQYQ